jgi:hypothetical protein
MEENLYLDMRYDLKQGLVIEDTNLKKEGIDSVLETWIRSQIGAGER